MVTPLTGVWIETAMMAWKDDLRHVTPLTGVWIETENAL